MTGQCNDKRLGDMLYAYELGILDGQDRREVELHLLRCEFCLERSRKFVKTAKLLKHDPDIQEWAGEMSTETAPTGSTKGFWKVVFPTLAAAAVLLLLVLGDWQLEFRPGQEAVAAQDRLAVMYFSNLSDPDDPDKLGEIITSLLITDLSESQHLQVVSSQHLYDVLKLIGHEGAKKIDEDLATRVAGRAAAKWFLTGNILQTQPQIVVTSQLVETASGSVIASQQITAEPGEGIFSLVDDLTIEIKEDLSLPIAFKDEPDPMIATVTTQSLEAYRNYLEAREFYYKAYFKECTARLRRAIELDPTFAMAYAQMAAVMWLGGDIQTADMVAMAVRYIDKATQKEQWWIRSLEAATDQDYQKAADLLEKLVARYPDEKGAYFHLSWLYRNRLGKQQLAAEALEKAVEIDPQFKIAWGALGRTYERMGDYEKAISAYNQSIALAPEEAYPYTRVGHHLSRQGKIDEAIDYYEQALSRRPDFHEALRGVAPLYLFQRDYTKAEETYRALIRIPRTGLRSDARTGLALIPLCQGKLNDALRVLEDGIGADRLENATHGEDGDRAHKHWLKAWIHLVKSDQEAADSEFQNYLDVYREFDPESLDYGRMNVVRLLAAYGQLVEAIRLYDQLMSDLAGTELAESCRVRGEAVLAYARGDYKKAIDHFENIPADLRTISDHYLMGRSYFSEGLYERAIGEFSDLTERHEIWRFYNCIWAAQSHYYLAIAYENLNQADAAQRQYETFLMIWKDADPGIPEIENARRRLARLTETP